MLLLLIHDQKQLLRSVLENMFLEFNNSISNYLKLRQNSLKIPAEKFIFIKAVGLQPAVLLKE